MSLILLLGATGQVGWELQRALPPLGAVTPLGSRSLDLCQPDAIRALIRRLRPDVIINAAAYTDVDGAEQHAEIAYALNAAAPGVLAEEAQALGAAFIHYSTDFVFDGTKTTPYVETDAPNPLGVYAQSKLAGERAVEAVGGASITIRTAWMYSTRRPSFLTRTLAWARKLPDLKIVTDQTGSPTWCRLLAEATAQVIAMGGRDLTGWLAERRGIYHLAGEGGCSRFEWAQAILRYDPQPEGRLAKTILPARTADFPTPAARPAYSVLNTDKFADTFGIRFPPWEAGLRLAMEAG
jgi:dTDP-4-dehydrorhamnose reductase